MSRAVANALNVINTVLRYFLLLLYIDLHFWKKKKARKQAQERQYKKKKGPSLS